MESLRLRFKAKAKKEQINKILGRILDRRFLPLRKRVSEDVDRANFKNLDLRLYLRLAGWAHTGGSYSNTMVGVKALCETMFGYAPPEKIGKYFLKKCRYLTGKGLADVGAVVSRYHEERLKK